jgi:hypothetical protein
MGSMTGAATPAQRAEFERTGYLAFDPGIDEATIDRVFGRLKGLYPPEGSAADNMGGAVAYRDARRIQDGWKIDADIKAIATAPRVLAMLRSLYGREPLPFQTLNFSVGSEQKTHSDTIHFNSRPAGFMCGVWVALEDIDSRNGPVVYYPGTHTWKELALPDIDAFDPPQAPTGRLARVLNYLRVPARNTDEDYAKYERLVQSRIDAAGAQPVYATIRKGEAFIWASNLLHGGSHQVDRSRSRMSQVTHYFFEGCRYYTPLLQRGWKTRWRRPDWVR